jgi:hypothetical protein
MMLPALPASLGTARARRAAGHAAIAFLIAACSGDEGPAAPASASLAVSVEGLPDGIAGAVTVSGAGGFSRTVTGSTVLEELAPGAYVIAGAPIHSQGARFEATPERTTLTLQSTASPLAVRVVYAVATGALSVEAIGLPEGVGAMLTVTGPGNFRQAVAAGDTLRGLRPGAYRLEALDVSDAEDGYAPDVRDRPITLAASTNVTTERVRYQASTGKLTVSIGGLPSGASAAVTVTGPNGFSQAIASGTTLRSLLPGDYVIAASPVVVSGNRYEPSPASRTIAVPASRSGVSANVAYALASGSLAVAITGLPAGSAGSVTVTGPDGVSRALTGTQTLTSLAPGSYTVAAAPVAIGGAQWNPTPASQTVSVVSSLTAAVANVAYAAPPGSGGTSLDLAIDGMYVTQAVQNRDGSVPLVAGRDGLLRVFVRANETNGVAPAVRVRIYLNGALQRTSTIASPGASTPTDVAEGTLTASWNLVVPASLVQPGLSILADVDSDALVVEANEGNNTFPASGSPLALVAQVVPTFNVTFVPVRLRFDTTQVGNVSASNAEQYLADARRMLPILGVNTQLHAPYTTRDSLALQGNDANGEWLNILSEISALRAAEGSSRHYYGVVRTTYSSGIAGYGYVPGRAAIGWDRLPSGGGVAAHEWGHNFGRRHAPCGGVGNPDPNYPYAGGTTGVYGYDVAAGVLNPPTYTDLMGYCGSTWISDYNYAGIMSYRASSPFEVAAVGLGAGIAAGAERALMVWGRIEGDRVTLEPAFALETTPVLPGRRGPHRVEAVVTDGRVLWSYAFEGDEPADLARPGVRHFAFAIPISAAQEGALAEVRVVSGARRAVRHASTSAARPLPGAARREIDVVGVGSAARLRWDASRYAMALVRDRRTGEVLTFARGGAVRAGVRSGTELEVLLSDGVRTLRESVRVP